MAIDAQIRYDIIAGNDRGLFALDSMNGTLFLEREIDLDQERSLPGNTFVLQIQASQVDNPLKMGVARVEVEVMDLNDNLPEFEVDFYNISIVENLPNGFSVLQVMIKKENYFAALDKYVFIFFLLSLCCILFRKKHILIKSPQTNQLLLICNVIVNIIITLNI